MVFTQYYPPVKYAFILVSRNSARQGEASEGSDGVVTYVERLESQLQHSVR